MQAAERRDRLARRRDVIGEALEQVKLPARVFRMAPRGRAAETLKRALQEVEPWMLTGLELRPPVCGHGASPAASIARTAGQGKILGHTMPVPRPRHQMFSCEIFSPRLAPAPDARAAVSPDQALESHYRRR